MRIVNEWFRDLHHGESVNIVTIIRNLFVIWQSIGSTSLERFFHFALAEYHVIGEWFNLGNDYLEIRANLQSLHDYAPTVQAFWRGMHEGGQG